MLVGSAVGWRCCMEGEIFFEHGPQGQVCGGSSLGRVEKDLHAFERPEGVRDALAYGVPWQSAEAGA
ncbi:MAG: hypothetical protein ACRBN8_38725 [Nannocystales bacterium]